MKVFVGDKLYDTRMGIVGIILESGDRENIASIPNGGNVYAVADESVAQEEVQRIVALHSPQTVAPMGTAKPAERKTKPAAQAEL